MDTKIELSFQYIRKRTARKLTWWKAQPDLGKRCEGWLITAMLCCLPFTQGSVWRSLPGREGWRPRIRIPQKPKLKTKSLLFWSFLWWRTNKHANSRFLLRYGNTFPPHSSTFMDLRTFRFGSFNNTKQAMLHNLWNYIPGSLRTLFLQDIADTSIHFNHIRKHFFSW